VRQETVMKGRVRLHVENTLWMMDVDGKPIIATRDRRWLRLALPSRFGEL
jgi:hypothetical protein